MVDARPTVGVVTVTYNSGKVLPDFLKSMAAQSGANLRLYVVDNDSHDDSSALVRAFHHQAIPTSLTENDSNLGVAEANNQGILAAIEDGCEFVLLLNNDTLFAQSTIADLLREAVDGDLDIVSPLIEATDPPSTVWYSSGHLVPSQGFRTFHDGTGAPTSTFPKELRRTGYASTCALLVRKKVFDAIGIMDPVYFVYFDDVDFAVRATRAGISYWVTPAALVTHKASSLTGGKSSDFTLRWYTRNWALIAKRHLSGPRGLMALLFIQAWMVARLVLRRDSFRVYRLRWVSFWQGVAKASAPAAPRLPSRSRGKT